MLQIQCIRITQYNHMYNQILVTGFLKGVLLTQTGIVITHQIILFMMSMGSSKVVEFIFFFWQASFSILINYLTWKNWFSDTKNRKTLLLQYLDKQHIFDEGFLKFLKICIKFCLSFIPQLILAVSYCQFHWYHHYCQQKHWVLAMLPKAVAGVIFDSMWFYSLDSPLTKV